jgi:hypothetical protein
MAKADTDTMCLRTERGLNDEPSTAAASVHRSIANMVGALVRDYCGRLGIEITDETVTGLTDGKSNPNKSPRARRLHESQHPPRHRH